MLIRRKDGTVFYDGPKIPLRDAVLAASRQPFDRQVFDLDLAGWDLAGQDIDGLQFSRCDFSGARLGRVPTAPGERTLVMFNECDLSGARLDRSDMSFMLLTDCDLRRASMRGTDVTRSQFARCDLSGVKATGLQGVGASFGQCDIGVVGMARANLAGSMLDKATFKGTRIDRADLSDCDLARADFSGARVAGASFRKARMQSSVFTEATVSGCDLGGADLRDERPWHARRGKGFASRTSGATVTGNSYHATAVGHAVDLFKQAKAQGVGGFMPGSLSAAARDLYGHAWGNVLDASLPAFVRDRYAQMVITGIIMGASAGVASKSYQALQALTEAGGAAGAGLGAFVAFSATQYLGRAVSGQVGKLANLGLQLLTDQVRPMLGEMRRRGANLADLVVLFATGRESGRLLGRALSRSPTGLVGNVVSAATGDVHVTVCDVETFQKAMDDIALSVVDPELLKSDIVLVREGGGTDAPACLRLHAGGGITATYAPGADGVARSRTWSRESVKGALAMDTFDGVHAELAGGLSGYDPVETRACYEARKAFYAALAGDLLAPLPPGAPVEDLVVTRHPGGALSAGYGDDGPVLVSPPEDADEWTGVRFGMT